MNGRAVFNFCARTVPEEVLGLLETRGLSVADIDLFCFHQASKYLLDTLRKRLKLPEVKVPIELYDFGNTVSSSIPLLLEDRLNEAKLSPYGDLRVRGWPRRRHVRHRTST